MGRESVVIKTCLIHVIELTQHLAFNYQGVTNSLTSQEIFMTKNVGGIDRILRAVIGLVLIGLAATGTVGWWGYLGFVPLATAAMGWQIRTAVSTLLNTDLQI